MNSHCLCPVTQIPIAFVLLLEFPFPLCSITGIPITFIFSDWISHWCYVLLVNSYCLYVLLLRFPLPLSCYWNSHCFYVLLLEFLMPLCSITGIKISFMFCYWNSHCLYVLLLEFLLPSSFILLSYMLNLKINGCT